MKKWLIIIGILVALGAIGYLGFRYFQTRQQANAISSLQTVAAAHGNLIATVGATGAVRSDQTGLILWQTTGVVDNVYVQLGQQVTAGEKLADLAASSLPQTIIMAQSDLISARDALAKLTNPDPATISTAEKALAAAYTAYQQAQNDLTNAVITNQNSNDAARYNDWLATKTALDVARNNLPLVNTSIDVQAYYQAVRKTNQLQQELTLAKENAAAHPDDALLAQKVTALDNALQDSLAKQDSLLPAVSPDMASLVKTLSSQLATYDNSTQDFIGTVYTDTLNAGVDLAAIQADQAQKQSTLINTQTNLDDLINHRQNMNGKRCDDSTISDYQDAYDAALKAWDFTGHIPDSREYQALQTAAANLNWCNSVWSQSDIAQQDAKIASTRAQVQLLQAQITADQNQIADATNSVYGLAINLNNLLTAYQDAGQQLDSAITTLYELERSPNPDDLATAQARLQAAQATVDSQALTAPFAGTVTEVDIKPGDQVSPATTAFRLDNVNRLLVDVLVSEVDINSIQVGQPVDLSFDAILDKQYTGKVDQVAPVGDAIQGVVQFNVTVELADADANVKPGMTAAVNIIVNQVSDALLVPNRAVRLVSGQRVVYILSNGQLQRVNVTLGASSDTSSQVIGGDLKEGDQVVLNPPQDLFGTNGGLFGR